MHRSLIFLVLAFLSLSLTASCDSITVAIPLAGKCHSRADGSALKAVEDANGKQWPVVRYPTRDVFGTTLDGVCAVPIEAKQALYEEPPRTYLQVGSGGRTTEYTYQDPSRDRWWLHPETREPIKAGVLGSHQGFLDIDMREYEWY